MIIFMVTIQEEERGRVRVLCDTPAGKATPAEIKCGMQFKTKFKEWSRGRLDTDWAHEVKPGKN